MNRLWVTKQCRCPLSLTRPEMSGTLNEIQELVLHNHTCQTFRQRRSQANQQHFLGHPRTMLTAFQSNERRGIRHDLAAPGDHIQPKTQQSHSRRTYSSPSPVAHAFTTLYNWPFEHLCLQILIVTQQRPLSTRETCRRANPPFRPNVLKPSTPDSSSCRSRSRPRPTWQPIQRNNFHQRFDLPCTSPTNHRLTTRVIQQTAPPSIGVLAAASFGAWFGQMIPRSGTAFTIWRGTKSGQQRPFARRV